MGFLARNKCAVAVVCVVSIAVIVGIVLAVTLTQSSSKSDANSQNVSYYMLIKKINPQDINLIFQKLFFDYANRREHSQLIMIAIHF